VLFLAAGLVVLYRILVMIPMRTAYGPPPQFSYASIGGLLYAIAIAMVVVLAVLTKNYLLGYLVSGVKIVFPHASTFMRTLAHGGTIDFSTFTASFNFIFLLLFIAWLVFFIMALPSFSLKLKTPTMGQLILPLIVLAYGFVYLLPENTIITSGLILLAFLLGCGLGAIILYIAVFISIPFQMIQMLVNGNKQGGTAGDITGWLIFHWVISFILLGYGIFYLVTNMKNIKAAYNASKEAPAEEAPGAEAEVSE